MRYHPLHQMDLPISKEVYDALLAAAFDTGLEKQYWEVGEAAIRDWMARNRPDAFPLHGVSGYQWKHVFLPTRTLLRTVFNGRNFHCMVEGDHIYYAGAQVSPSGFVNAVGGTLGKMDGQTFSWDELGHALMCCEGWQFKLDLADRSDKVS
jgi:hypothetical protein